ncbi:MAG: beta-lactamase family protein [Lachnospiraceae bacterium]|nr:beta-lactamase family protein [Lachnospiraceae bacterium]
MNEKEIDKVMGGLIERGEMPGAELWIHADGKEAYHGIWGYSNLETRNPMAEDTILCMCSMTKVLTVVGFLRLVEQGEIGLDDEVRKFIPAFAAKRVVADERFEGMEAFARYFIQKEPAPLSDVKTAAANRELTVRDLLTHSSGLEMGTFCLLSRLRMQGREETLRTRVEKLARMPLDFQPGTATGYSPTASMDTLARLVEIITGQDFAVYMREEIFDPLEMADMTFHLSEEQKGRRMPLYKMVDGRMVDVTGSGADIDGLVSGGPNLHSASGGAFGRMGDYHKVTRMLAQEGELNGVRILKPETVRMLYEEHAYRHLEPEPGMEWGLGVKVRQDPERAQSYAVKGTYGWSGAYGTHMFVCPDKKLAVTFGTNREDLGGSESYISREVERLVFGIWG